MNIPVSSWNWVYQDPAGPNLGLLAANVTVGPSDSNEVTITATGISPGAPGYVPQNVLLQARQQANADYGFSDEFALQVIDSDLGVLGGNSLTFKVKRLDASQGWGQELQVDILIMTIPQFE